MILVVCKLCLKDNELCKSHIYPEYMYKNCYDDNHSYIEFNADEDSYNTRRRKGIYEKLLCRDCEDIIMEYEDYAKGILYDKAKPYIHNYKSGFVIKDYNYKIFKLFVLSLLWRASVSNRDSFSLANLGPYEDKLRIILLNQLDTPVYNFPCLIYQTYLKDKPADGVFMEIHPKKSITDERTVYQFVADGLFFFIGVGDMSIKTFSKGTSVSPEHLRIGYDQLSNIKSIVDLFVRVQQQGKFAVYEK